jgi:ribosomal protein S18 acetylase RimI-like enzyme
MSTIRRAVAADAAVLAVFAERTFRDSFADRNTEANMNEHCARHFGPEIQAFEISDRGRVTLLAEDAGRLAGFAQLRFERAADGVSGERPVELQRIYVASEWHGRGVAQEIMRETRAVAAAALCDTLWLGVWEHNQKAIAFYLKQGFRTVGEHAFMLGQEAQRDLVMSKQVN